MISSHVISANDFNAFARVPKPAITISIAAPPKIPENPDILPTAVTAILTSARAPPIAASPLPIWSQFISPNDFIASANFDKPNITISMAKAPNIDFPPLNLFKTLTASTSSPRAPPIATNPRPISFHAISPNFLSASLNMSHAFARAIIDIEVLNGILTSLIAFIPFVRINKPPPMPIRPLTI